MGVPLERSNNKMSLYDKASLVEKAFAAFGAGMEKAIVSEEENIRFIGGQYPSALDAAASALDDVSKLDKIAAQTRSLVLLQASAEWVNTAERESKSNPMNLKNIANYFDNAATDEEAAGTVDESKSLFRRELAVLKDIFASKVEQHSEFFSERYGGPGEAGNDAFGLAKRILEKKEFCAFAREMFDISTSNATKMRENKKYKEAADIDALAADIAKDKLNDAKLQTEQLLAETQDLVLLSTSIREANQKDPKQLARAAEFMARAADIMKDLEKSMEDDVGKGSTFHSNEAGALYQLAGDAAMEKDPFEAVKWYETAIRTFLKFGNEFAANKVQDGKDYRDAKRRTLAPARGSEKSQQ